MLSPSPSLESSDSFEIVSPRSMSSYNRVSDALSSDEDEIVWSVSDSAFIEPLSPISLSDDDFIVLNAPLSSTSSDEQHGRVNSITVSRYRIDQPRSIEQETAPIRNKSPAPSSDATPPSSPRRKNGKRRGPAEPAPSSSTATNQSSSAKKRNNKKRNIPPNTSIESSPRGLGARSIVDDCSERGEDPGAHLYEQAVHYISCFLSDPMENKAAHLALLQALIIELGFLTIVHDQPDIDTRIPSPTPSSSFDLSALPNSMRAAKSFIKANVFLNVKDYIAVRSQGQEALQRVLLPSRRALVTQLRKKSSRVPRDWVKERGLNVFLVSCH